MLYTVSLHTTILAFLLTASYGQGIAQAISSQSTISNESSLSIHSCPPWFIPSQQIDGSIHCACGDLTTGHIRCNDRDQSNLEVSLQLSKCMTFDEDKGDTFEFNCVLLIFTNATNKLFTPLPSNLSDLNEFTCGKAHREGLLCGTCIKDYGPSLYNYELECTECTQNIATNWCLFFLITFVPVTILLTVVILAAPVNLMSPRFSTFILFSQLTTLPGNLWGVTQAIKQFPGVDTERLLQTIKVFFSLYGIWNLDFFRPYIRLCLTENMSHIQAYFLEYLVALYVIVLLVAVFVLLELHDRNFRIVVWVIKPLRYWFRKFAVTRSLDIRTSTIHAFATFVTLMSVKIGTVSLHAFQHTELINRTGDTVSPTYFYFDTNVEYMTGSHLALAIVAIILLITVVLPTPLLLIVYQFKWFQKATFCLPFSIREGLRVYMDSFQGYYHNGSDHDQDYRFFSSVNFLIRILSFTLQEISFQFSLLVMTVTCIVTAIAYTTIRPYKTNCYNTIDGILLVNLGFLYLSTLLLGLLDLLGLSVNLLQVILPTLLIVPILYLILYGCHKIIKKLRLKIHLRNVRNECSVQCPTEQNVEQPLVADMIDSLPDRINNPHLYTQSGLI